MPDLLIRNLEPHLIKSLKFMAKMHHHSLQKELKSIIEMAIQMSPQEALQTSLSWHQRLSEGNFTDSAKLLREDRDKK